MTSLRFFSFALFCASLVPLNAQTLLVGQLYDVENARVLSQQQVTINNDVIAAISDANATTASSLRDLRGYALMPGWIDAHTHLIGDIQNSDVLAPIKQTPAQEMVLAQQNAGATVLAGFTTVRDVGTYRGLLDVELRDRLARGEFIGPRLFVAGAYLTRRGGGGEVVGGPAAEQIPNAFRRGVADTSDELRQRVRELAAGKVDFLKVIATGAVLTNGTVPGESEFNYEQLRSLVDEAKRFNLDVTAHAHGAAGIKDAIRAGVRSIEHASLIDDEGIQLAKQHGTYLVMDIYNGDYISDVGHREKWDAEILQKNDLTTAAQREGFRKAVLAGVNVVYGTDSGVYPHGNNAKQFAYMVRYGMTTMQAVQAATIVAATLLRQEKQIGSITVGKQADLVALPIDPKTQLPDFSAKPIVFKAGKQITR